MGPITNCVVSVLLQQPSWARCAGLGRRGGFNAYRRGGFTLPITKKSPTVRETRRGWQVEAGVSQGLVRQCVAGAWLDVAGGPTRAEFDRSLIKPPVKRLVNEMTHYGALACSGAGRWGVALLTLGSWV